MSYIYWALDTIFRVSIFRFNLSIYSAAANANAAAVTTAVAANANAAVRSGETHISLPHISFCLIHFPLF